MRLKSSPAPAEAAPQTGLLEEHFEAARRRCAALGDRLSDDQLLELADLYHQMLRQRRAIRARHPAAAGRFIDREPRSFAPP